MNTSNFAKHLVILTVLGFLAACGGGGSAPATAPPASVTASINAAGGTVTGPDGVQVVIPGGALNAPTEIGIARDGKGAPELGGLRLISSVYAITPHGTQFAESARVSIPFNPADVAPGTRPVIIKSQPGGTWTALISDGVGNSLAADTSGLSYYAVGTCYTSRDATVGGPDPLLYCPANHSLQLRLQDGSGVSLPVPRNALGNQLPAITVSTVTTLNLNAEYDRPAGVSRNDLLSVWAFGAGLSPSQQPLTDFVVNNNTAIPTISAVIDPSKVPLAGQTGGVVIRIKAFVTYTTDAFYLGCVCFKPASWTFEAEVPVRVIYIAPAAPAPAPVPVPAPAPVPVPAPAPVPVPAPAPVPVPVPVPAPLPLPPTYAIGGTVSGLTGAGLVLRNNGGDDRAVTANGAFTFATVIGVGAPYSVAVFTQPAGQTCTVQNGSGLANADVANVAVACVALPAANWTAAMVMTAAGKIAFEPAVGSAIDGHTTLAWGQYDTDQYNGHARRFDPATAGWQASQLIENLATNTAQSLSAGVYSPRVAMGANQRAHILFGFSVQPGSFHIGMSRFTGGAWVSQLLTTGGNANDHALSFTGDGNTALMMYSQHDGVSRYAIRSQAYQYGNGALASISPEGGTSLGSSSYSAAAALGSSDAVGTWIGQSQFVYVNRFNGATQTWGAPVNLNASSTGNAYPHAIAGNAGGNAAVVWLDLNGGYRVYASRLSGTTWSTPVTLATPAQGAPRNFDTTGVSVATGLDTSGNAYFAWGQEDLASPFTVRLYVSRCPIGQAMSGCESRIQMDTRNDRMGRPGLAVAPNGDVWVAWVARTTTGSEVRIRQRSSTGWSAVVTLGSSLDSNVAPSIAIDGLNRVTVAWEGADRRIYVARRQ